MEMWHTGTWAIWRPPATWRRVLRTMFWSHRHWNMKALCASTAKSHFEWSSVVRRRHLDAKNHDFWKSRILTHEHPGSLQWLSNGSWTSPGCPWVDSVIIDFSSFSQFWKPRSPFSQRRFFALEGTSRIHGLLTYPSGFPRWHFDCWGHMTMW